MSTTNNDSTNLLTKDYEENPELQKKIKKKDNSKMSIAHSLFLKKGIQKMNLFIQVIGILKILNLTKK